MNYLMVLPILILLLIIYGRGPTTLLPIFPLLICIQTILIVGLGLIIATANVFYRDVQHLTTIALRLLFFLTPIFYQSKVSTRAMTSSCFT